MKLLHTSNNACMTSLLIRCILLITLSLLSFPRAGDCCSNLNHFDVSTNTSCPINDHLLNHTESLDTDIADHQDYMLRNIFRQTTQSLRLSTPRASSALRPLTSTPYPKQNNRTMSSSAAEPSTEPQNPQEVRQENDDNNMNSESSASTPKLALPAVPGGNPSDTHKIDVSGQGTTVPLDHLGPIVVNQDGSMSRISNWDKMTEMEQKNTLRIIGKRNKQRLEALKAAGVEAGESS